MTHAWHNSQILDMMDDVLEKPAMGDLQKAYGKTAHLGCCMIKIPTYLGLPSL